MLPVGLTKSSQEILFEQKNLRQIEKGECNQYCGGKGGFPWEKINEVIANKDHNQTELNDVVIDVAKERKDAGITKIRKPKFVNPREGGKRRPLIANDSEGNLMEEVQKLLRDFVQP